VANYGQAARFVTVLPPANPIVDAFLGQMRAVGVDVSMVKRQAGRFGIYFVEPGANQRPSKVVYDREHSAIALAKPATSTGGRFSKAPRHSTSPASRPRCRNRRRTWRSKPCGPRASWASRSPAI
jgi:sugar/nucleoside kinase (ribokinase family)